MAGTSAGDLGVDTAELVAAADALTLAGRVLAGGAGGVDRAVPPLPDDEHGLVLAIVRYDEAREGFDQRAAHALASLGHDLAAQALESTRADTFVPLPVAAR